LFGIRRNNGFIDGYVNQSTMTPYGKTVSRSTISNPSWRIQIAKRQDAGMQYLVESQKCTVGTSTCEGVGIRSWKGYTSEGYVRTLGLLPTTFLSTDTTTQQTALTRLKRKLKKRAGGADALVPILEARELRGLFRQAVSMSERLLLVLINAKRSKGRSIKRYAKDIHKRASEAWLAYGFGIRPIISDIQNVALAIDDFFNQGDIGIRDSASAKKTWLTHSKLGPYTGIAGADLYYQATLLHTLSYRWYCGGQAAVNAGNDYGILAHLGFSGENLLPAFWELVPYSWVVDYFTTVGTFLDDTFNVIPGSMFYSGYTRRYECKAQVITTWKPWTDYVISPSNMTNKFERFEFERIPLGGALPHAGLRFRSMDEIGNFGVSKLLNLASVLIQRI
jgi:hypothetical protein